MPLEPLDHQHLNAAEGFVALGMFEDANAELERIDPFRRALPEVLAVRLAIYERSGRWELAEVVAEKLAAHEPRNPQRPISLAYATRRLSATERVQAILNKAIERHPNEAAIPYNLACYACERGDLVQAHRFLRRAFALQPNYRALVLDDPD